jgi:glutamate-ammonia-ligase adenylyltransferase
VELVRESVREMKGRIEAELQRQGRKWGEVKSGEGSIRDIEFVAQFLQLAHGGAHKEVRSFNTLDALVRLADFGFLRADEFRQLTSGYVFLRTVEHALQRMHHKQTHALPDDRRELAYLARRLDYPDARHFLAHYEQTCEAIRAIYERYIGGREHTSADEADSPADLVREHRARMEPSYSETFSEEEIRRHAALLERLNDEHIVEVDAVPLEGGRWRVTVAGFDAPGDLSMICGLLFVYGFDILDGDVFTAEQVSPVAPAATAAATPRAPAAARKFVDVFTVQPPPKIDAPAAWKNYQRDLAELLHLVGTNRQREAQGRLAKRVAAAVRGVGERAATLLPVEIEIDNATSPRATVLHIRADDTIGFLYELTNALTLAGVDVGRVIVSSVGNRVFDTLFVTDVAGDKITEPHRQQELRAAVVLIKHFTHLLPRSPNPEAALLHFRDFLEQLFQQPHWVEELSSLERPDVLAGLARLLGVSNFLWEDFLRLQHANLFPVVKDVEALARRKTKQELEAELDAELAAAADGDDRRARLNAFKDRGMFRTDMRHIIGHIPEIGQFSEELTDVAEVVVAAAYRITDDELRARYGEPRLICDDRVVRRSPDRPTGPTEGLQRGGGTGPSDDRQESGEDLRSAEGAGSGAPRTTRARYGERPCPISVCALGKCGGRELGFASDIELMFLYEDNGRTTGPEVITNAEYFQKLVESFMQTMTARRQGIFEIDLRLRPYGRAGSLAVSLDAFRQYFEPHGPAWPYERQALVKLRAVAGDAAFGRRIAELRDELVYTGEPFDVAAMRAMREKQVRQLVQAGTVNAKLSPGGLVDIEYLVQGLQITYGHTVVGRSPDRLTPPTPGPPEGEKDLRSAQRAKSGDPRTAASAQCRRVSEKPASGFGETGLHSREAGGLQSLRDTNTRAAMAALEEAGVLSAEEHQRLLEAYVFQRRLIDALRMVRGHARDLTLPAAESEEFEFLARRLGYVHDPLQLAADVEHHTGVVQELTQLLDQSR